MNTLEEKHIKSLIRPNILALKPYSTARDECKAGDIDVWLDANESPFCENGFNRYPDPRQKELKALISRHRDIPADHIFVGNGSDEAIDLMYRIFCRPGIDNAVAITPTYGMYGVAAEINDVKMREVQLSEDFSLPVGDLLAAADENTRLMWICSPNNPTGNAFPCVEIERLLKGFSGIVVVDEAYIDFSGEMSATRLIERYPNLVVLQTMSKAMAMAGLRVGMAFSNPLIISYMDMVKYPYNVNQMSQAIAMELYGKAGSQIKEILKERARFAGELSRLPQIRKVYPSDANFLLVKVDSPDALYDALTAHGIIVRNRSHLRGCEGCLRITVGLPGENDRVIECISNFRN